MPSLTRWKTRNWSPRWMKIAASRFLRVGIDALVESFELRIGASEVTLRRGDLPMAGEPLRRRQALLGPERDRDVPEPVWRDVLRESRELRRVPNDLLRGPYRHSVRAVRGLLPRHEQRLVVVSPSLQVLLKPLTR